ncbi:Sialic acid TRAP transporter permease protein SiaT [Castellaniella defragrans]
MNRFVKTVRAVEDWVPGILILTSLSLLLYGVVLRYIFHASSTWQNEAAGYFVVWGAMIGASTTLRDNKHIRVDILYDYIPRRFQKWIDVFANIVSFGFFLFIFYYGTQLVAARFATGEESLDGFPLWIAYLVLPLTGILMMTRMLIRIFNLFRTGTESGEQIS